MGGHIHVVGVAGVGMSALAQALCWTHDRVTGSDRNIDRGIPMPVLDGLRTAGIELVQQDGAAIHSRTEAVVYSTAIEAENPDMAAAKKYGLPLKHRAAVLAELVPKRGVLAVAGTAGKTTTTGMLGWTLEQLGAEPTVINGGALVNWADAAHVGNVRRGAKGAPWVIEVDESDRSLLNFHPDWSILTNMSQDHFSLAEVQDLFRAYAAQVQTGIVCGAGVMDVLGPQTARMVEAAATPQRAGAGFDLPWRGQRLMVPQPGAHNALDALLAAELCAQLGYAAADIATVLARFGGIQRRLERVDQNGPVRVVDDYGHNPAKLIAAWEAIREPGRRVLGVWRPHGFGPLRSMLDPLADALATVWHPGDKLWVLPVYDAGGTADRSIQSDALVAKVGARGVDVELADSYEALGTALLQTVRPGDTILIMGARDPHLPIFARELAARTTSLVKPHDD